jgi:hypothetical protein
MPLVTEKTKLAIRDITVGLRGKIDAVNASNPLDTIVTDMWVSREPNGAYLHYKDGPDGAAVYLGPADVVRTIIAKTRPTPSPISVATLLAMASLW